MNSPVNDIGPIFVRSRPRSPSCEPSPFRASALCTVIHLGCRSVSAAAAHTSSADRAIVASASILGIASSLARSRARIPREAHPWCGKRIDFGPVLELIRAGREA